MHNEEFITKTIALNEKDFIIWMLYKKLIKLLYALYSLGLYIHLVY